ncbi:hypothetical protein STANM309S_05072 [Streptomyces tanashiensis]
MHLKVEGANTTGSFKDRGMTMAISKAKEEGAQAVICASTGNTSASAAAYAVRAGMVSAVLVPQGKIALGKMGQALVHGAKILQVDGNFDDCLTLARSLSENYPVALVNSVNPVRIEGQKTAAFEIVDMLGDAPDIHVLPVGNAGNITAYWKGYREYAADGLATHRPRMWGFQASGSAPLVRGEVVKDPSTIATAIRIGNPASWDYAIAARDESGGFIDEVTDREILQAYRLLAAQEGVFVEPASAASVAGLLKAAAQGKVDPGQRIVCTVTGNGLKDPDWAVAGAPQPVTVPVDAAAAAERLVWPDPDPPTGDRRPGKRPAAPPAGAAALIETRSGTYIGAQVGARHASCASCAPYVATEPSFDRLYRTRPDAYARCRCRCRLRG